MRKKIPYQSIDYSPTRPIEYHLHFWPTFYFYDFLFLSSVANNLSECVPFVPRNKRMRILYWSLCESKTVIFNETIIKHLFSLLFYNRVRYEFWDRIEYSVGQKMCEKYVFICIDTKQSNYLSQFIFYCKCFLKDGRSK